MALGNSESELDSYATDNAITPKGNREHRAVAEGYLGNKGVQDELVGMLEMLECKDMIKAEKAIKKLVESPGEEKRL